MARLALYTLKYIDKSAGYKHDLFSDDPGLPLGWISESNRIEYEHL